MEKGVGEASGRLYPPALLKQRSGRGGKSTVWFCGQRKANGSYNDQIEIEVGNVL